MGMTMSLFTLHDDTISRMLEDPDELHQALDRLGDEEVEGEPSDEWIEYDLDKAWQAVHFLLNGSVYGSGRLASLIAGGQPIGTEEVGYTVPRAMTSREVAEFATALSKVSVDELRRRYNGRLMDDCDVYPRIWSRDGEQGAEYVAENYEQLLMCVQTAVQKKLGLLICIM